MIYFIFWDLIIKSKSSESCGLWLGERQRGDQLHRWWVEPSKHGGLKHRYGAGSVLSLTGSSCKSFSVRSYDQMRFPALVDCSFNLREFWFLVRLLGHPHLPVGQEEAEPESAEHEEDTVSDLPGSGVEPWGADAQRPAQVPLASTCTCVAEGF